MTKGFLGCLLKNLLEQKASSDSKDVQSRTHFAKLTLGGNSCAWKTMCMERIKKEEHLISLILGHLIHEGSKCGSRPECLLFQITSGLLQDILFINVDEYFNYINNGHYFNPLEVPNFFLHILQHLYMQFQQYGSSPQNTKNTD